MTIIEIIQFILSIITNQDLVLKLILVVFLVLYTLFAIIVARQIFILNEIVNQISFSPVFKFLAIMHALISATLLVITILVI